MSSAERTPLHEIDRCHCACHDTDTISCPEKGNCCSECPECDLMIRNGSMESHMSDCHHQRTTPPKT